MSLLKRAASSSASASAAEARRRHRQRLDERNRNFAGYAAAVAMGTLGMSYAAVPLYRMFCQVTGFGGTTQVAEGASSSFRTATSETQVTSSERVISVRFNADVTADMPWKFTPNQTEAKVLPGETALAFYDAVNKTDKPITGIATYNVSPPKAGIYFNKVQCFCFEEQRLKPHEKVEMPVFFFIDPEFEDDPKMDDVDSITLSYTFFRAENITAAELQASAWSPPDDLEDKRSVVPVHGPAGLAAALPTVTNPATNEQTS